MAVYRVEAVRDRGEKVLRVLEFIGSERPGDALARAVLDAGTEQGVAFADFYCTTPFWTLALETVGFVREEGLPAPLPSLFQPLDFRQARLNGAFWLHPRVAQESQAVFCSPEFVFDPFRLRSGSP